MRSKEFDDVYFSVDDGLAETEYVFLKSNNLPAGWVDQDHFTICELGFGTGLNMLAAWRLFDQTAHKDARLDLVSIEKFPLSRDEIRDALGRWNDELGSYLQRLLDIYPIRVPGFHRMHLSDRVTLTLVFEDVGVALSEMDMKVDAWFLDGFAPAKNPDMWTDGVFGHIARLSSGGARLATFTAAGHVRRGLNDVGFDVQKVSGFGRKRDMVVATFSGQKTETKKPKKVVVIGAGIAGLSVAWHLKRAGVDVCVYDAGDTVASGASGNHWGLINPVLSFYREPIPNYYTACFAYAIRMFDDLIDWRQCGALHMQIDDDKARRFKGYLENACWHGDHIRHVDADEASRLAGIPIKVPCLYYPDAGGVSPKNLCTVLAENLDVHLNSYVDDLSTLDADVYVLACADGVTKFVDLPITTVRGQTTRLKAHAQSAVLKMNLSYGRYFSPADDDNLHTCGATFEPWSDDRRTRDEDDHWNMDQLKAHTGLDGFEIYDHWAGVRAATADRFPVTGRVESNEKPIYVSTGHGSHGIMSGLLSGAILASSIMGTPSPVPLSVHKILKPCRFAERVLKKAG